MKTEKQYLTPADLKNGSRRVVVRALDEEVIDGRPQMVMYFDDEPKGLILTRQHYSDLTAVLGRNEAVEAFFRKHGVQ